MFKHSFLFLLGFLFLYGCVPPPDGRAQPEAASGVSDGIPAVPGERFMVVAANPHAAKAGRRILRQGGSAVDAAIAMQMVRPRGTIVMKTSVAPNTDGTNIDLAPLVIHEIKMIGSRCGSFPEALEALSSEKVDVLSLISRRMKLSDGPDALRISTKSNVIKVLLEP